jgi:hypothetical protein
MTSSSVAGPEHLAPSGSGPDEARAEVTRLRAGVLGGRGPGASRSEFLQHTRARSAVGGVPVPERRDAVARAAAAARGDVERLSLEVAADRARLSASLGEVRSRLTNRSGDAPVAAHRADRLLRRAVRLALLVLGAGGRAPHDGSPAGSRPGPRRTGQIPA